MIGDPTFQATARFENGEARIRVTAIRPYGTRTASTSVDVDDETMTAKVAKVLESAIKSVSDELAQQSFKEAARAVTVAFDMEEKL
jgi:carbon monoxide dehydrogenase subunit G